MFRYHRSDCVSSPTWRSELHVNRRKGKKKNTTVETWEKEVKGDFQGANPLEIRRPDTEVSVYHTIVSSQFSSFEFIKDAVVIVVVIFVVVESIVVVIELTGKGVTVVLLKPVEQSVVIVVVVGCVPNSVVVMDENGADLSRDHDNDGMNDADDTDDDNDNILDVDEVDGATGVYRYDHDNDGIWDSTDTDDDNDGLSDWFEVNDGNSLTGQFDHDNDGVEDHLDDDDDNDGIEDIFEV